MDILLETVDGLCQTEISGIIPCGSTAEFINIGFEHNIFILKEIARVVAGRRQLIGGANSPDSVTALKYLNLMGNLGYTAAMVAPPYYFGYSDDEITAFYDEIGAAKFPVMAYNIPAFTTAISLNVYRQILEMEHIVAMKNSSANIKEIMHQLQIKNDLRRDFHVFTGTDDAIVPCVISGCSGSCTALAGIIPKIICSIYKKLKAGDIISALQIQQSILPVIRLADSFPFPVGYKLISLAMGRTIGPSKHSIPRERQKSFYPAVIELYRLLSEIGCEDIPQEPLSMNAVNKDLCF